MRQYLRVALVVLVAGVLISGCMTTSSAVKNRTLYVDAHPELSEMMADAILNGQIMVGMTADMVTASWGNPSRIEDVQEEGVASHWIYGNYFVGGNITNLFFDAGDKLVRYEVNYEPTHANSGTVSTKGDTPGLLSGSDGSLTKGSGNP